MQHNNRRAEGQLDIMFNDTVMNIGNTAKDRKNFDDPQDGRVYHPKGVAPTIRSCGGGKYLVLICIKMTK